MSERHPWPPVDETVTGRELDREVRAELKTLPLELATTVARHLVMVGILEETDPERAYEHARAVRERASRVAVARETAGLTAYATGRYAEALSELRAHARMSGSSDYLPVIADCERGLGRPEKALEIAGGAAAQKLDPAGRAEMRIVAAGARADMGQPDAAVITLQCKELTSRSTAPWVARLRYAYADALLAVGRTDDARTWFARAADGDDEGATDAADRLAELEGVVFLTDGDGDDDEEETESADGAGSEHEGRDDAARDEAGGPHGSDDG
jgi:tetratricopeptide (TPR) repeat protein